MTLQDNRDYRMGWNDAVAINLQAVGEFRDQLARLAAVWRSAADLTEHPDEESQRVDTLRDCANQLEGVINRKPPVTGSEKSAQTNDFSDAQLAAYMRDLMRHCSVGPAGVKGAIDSLLEQRAKLQDELNEARETVEEVRARNRELRNKDYAHG